MAAAKGKTRAPYSIFSGARAGIPMPVIKVICGAAALSLVVICSLVAQSPAEPKNSASTLERERKPRLLSND
jgi:hypothetical protein